MKIISKFLVYKEKTITNLPRKLLTALGYGPLWEVDFSPSLVIQLPLC